MRALDDETRQDFLDRLASEWEGVHAEALWVAERTGAGPRFEAQLERARELANEAVLRVVEGRRAWNRRIELRTFMGGAMRSIAAADWKRRQRHTPLADDVPDLPERRPSERLEERLDQAEAEAVIEEVREAATGDALCEAVVGAYLQGSCERPRHVAAHLGVPEQVVYNAQRKIARRVLAARKKKLPTSPPSAEELPNSSPELTRAEPMAPSTDASSSAAEPATSQPAPAPVRFRRARNQAIVHVAMPSGSTHESAGVALSNEFELQMVEPPA